jgi:tRNA (guanine-N7-)-methyltransferase
LRSARRFSLDELAPYLLEVPDPPVLLDFRSVFGNGNPVEMEVGFGKGLFLVNAALARPQVNFLGVEIAGKYQLFTATRMAKRGLLNVRLARADARSFLGDCVPAESCQAVHVYFPDPWWKKRHLKRRVFTPEFAVQCERVLRLGGHLYVVTDVQEYFGVMIELLARLPGLQPLPPAEPHDPTGDLDYLTNFERKFRKAGRPIYRQVYERSGSVHGAQVP